MNPKIKALEQQCWSHRIDGVLVDGHLHFDTEKFAELIIKQCVKSLWTEECHNSDLALEEFERNSAKIKEHFGVEE
jgi:hypothetical protein